jgi:hypothetical protein
MHIQSYDELIHDEAIITWESEYNKEFQITDPGTIAEAETSLFRCPHCKPEFDGNPVYTPRVTRDDNLYEDSYCPTCFNDARMGELQDFDTKLTGDTERQNIRPTHLIRWEYRPSQWSEPNYETDPHGFYSTQWTIDGKLLGEAEYIFGGHQFQTVGALRLPIPGMSVTARIEQD